MADYKRKDVEGFRYSLVKKIGVLSERSIQGVPWTLEANWISWNGKRPKLDIRSWDKETHQQMSKGVTLTLDEFHKLAELMSAEERREQEV